MRPTIVPTLLLLALTLGIHAQEIPGVSLVANGDLRAGSAAPWVTIGSVTATVVPAAAGSYDRAVRLTFTPPANANPWDVQWKQGCRGEVKRGETVYVRFWARSEDRATVGTIFEEADPPNRKAIDETARLTPEWKEYRFAGEAFRDLPAGRSQFALFLGRNRGIVDITGVRVENRGRTPVTSLPVTTDYWGGAAHPDTWRAAALARIEQIRKGPLTVRVVDSRGKPVPGATVRIEMTRHHFRFGSAAPVFRFVDTTDPNSTRFRDEVKRLFNTVTFENDLKWQGESPERWSMVQQAAGWLKANHIELRGHNLVWGSAKYLPPAIASQPPDRLRDTIKAHVQEYAGRMKGRVYLWDVVNEAGSETDIWDKIGWQSFADCFRWAKEADPDALLCYNDYNITNEAQSGSGYRAKVEVRIQYLLDHGAPVGVLGDQAHMSAPLTPIDRVLAIWDDWAAKFKKPIEVTEYDLGVKDDKVHGDYSRDYLIAAFSHPRVEGFIMWGFWEGSHWRAREGGAMVRRDWSKRSAAIAYEDLVLNQWWTRATAITGSNGAVTTPAFYGDYRIVIERSGKQIEKTARHLPGVPARIVVKLPQ